MLLVGRVTYIDMDYREIPRVILQPLCSDFQGELNVSLPCPLGARRVSLTVRKTVIRGITGVRRHVPRGFDLPSRFTFKAWAFIGSSPRRVGNSGVLTSRCIIDERRIETRKSMTTSESIKS